MKRKAYLPNLAFYFGLHPWDVDRLTLQEFDKYCTWIDQRTRGAVDD